MRLDPNLVHPSIFRASDEILYTGGSTSTPEQQAQWMKEHGWAFVAGILGFFIVMIPLLGALSSQPKAVKAAVVLGSMALLVTGMFWAFGRGQRQMSLAKMQGILATGKLTEAQKAYGQTIVALGQAGTSEFEIEETMRALNGLLDEEHRLLEMRSQLTGSQELEERGQLVEERDSLQARAAQAQDPSARLAFEQSLLLMEERIESHGHQGARLERIDAHLALLRQAVLATRDAARHRTGGAAATAPDLSTDALRSAVALARAQTQATEQALAELRAI